MYIASFFRSGEAESHGCSAREASCQTQCFTAMAGDLQSCASGHGETETSIPKQDLKSRTGFNTEDGLKVRNQKIRPWLLSSIPPGCALTNKQAGSHSATMIRTELTRRNLTNSRKGRKKHVSKFAKTTC